jgi:hypothetical protein
MLTAAVSSDVDTLSDIYKGQGCNRPGGYTYAELQIGLEAFDHFLEPYQAKATLFMVGNDFLPPENHAAIKAAHAAGHEIANHTMTHPQGFRLLSPAEKEQEIAEMEAACEAVVGCRPVGFRSPGWNIGDDTLPILVRRGYRYDSSVFPTLTMPVLKFMHWYSMRSRSGGDRTTMGHWWYMFAPRLPYQTGDRGFGGRGKGGLVEMPVTVMPVLRIPFFATWLLSTGIEVFRLTYRTLRALGQPIHFQFHLSDFVDYSKHGLADQVPAANSGLYVPLALQTDFAKKLDLFKRAMDTIAADYTFTRLDEWARAILSKGGAPT